MIRASADVLPRLWRQRLPQLGRRQRWAEPGAALFAGLRLRLCLWYSAVLLVGLAVVGISLYLTVSAGLFQQIYEVLQFQANFQLQEMQRTPGQPCPPRPAVPPGGLPIDRPRTPFPIQMACFDTTGRILASGFTSPEENSSPSAAFLRPSLVAKALRNGRASDIVVDQSGTPYLRLALAVREPATGQAISVLQFGHNVATFEQTRGLVRLLLLLLALPILLLAAGGGWFLAGRALAPAHLAFARQQTFIADASHELRTPLAILRADAEVLLRHRERFEAEDVELLEDVVSETEHMSQLATGLLTLARLDAGRLEFEREVVDLSQVAERLCRRVATLAAQKEISLHEACAGPALVMGDAEYLQRAALVLIDNAVKYTPRGGTVTVRAAVANAVASLAVEDTGVGIAAEHLRYLGQRFYRADKSRSRETGGTGIGLAIAFRIAAAHGGAITVTSEPGRGTRAALTLPALSPPAGSAEEGGKARGTTIQSR